MIYGFRSIRTYVRPTLINMMCSWTNESAAEIDLQPPSWLNPKGFLHYLIHPTTTYTLIFPWTSSNSYYKERETRNDCTGVRKIRRRKRKRRSGNNCKKDRVEFVRWLKFVAQGIQLYIHVLKTKVKKPPLVSRMVCRKNTAPPVISPPLHFKFQHLLCGVLLSSCSPFQPPPNIIFFQFISLSFFFFYRFFFPFSILHEAPRSYKHISVKFSVFFFKILI